MQIDKKLDEILAFIDSARTMPMSSSAMINKGELTALIEQLRDLLPEDIQTADAVLAERDAILEEARYNADRVTADARAEQAKLIADHEITAEARRERLKLLDAAQESADAVRRGVDAHVEAKLAHLEKAALALAETARSGREQLADVSAYTPVVTDTDDESTSTGMPSGDSARAGSDHTRFVPDVADYRAQWRGMGPGA